ncbi:IS5 family transposase [Leptospira weilii]|uniref:IS5 family transposase n=1 Tax=Leptospira weilii TaxID=28184 RepID=UPI001EF21C1E|nr:IS5 family transposase [Leptospira weilii]MDL5247494.1 IS5 family transposase [Leptospira weilii]ULH28461.1 IS5 family transposase [Leptospira weilii]UPY79947.1 IS5 family transposase [Leptospira weilii]
MNSNLGLLDIPEEIWKRLRPLLSNRKTNPQKGGRPRLDDRVAMAAIFYRVRTGIQWRDIPTMFGSKSTLHRRFQEWVVAGVFDKIEREALKLYKRSVKIRTKRMAVVGSFARFSQRGAFTGPNPTDRGKRGVKRHILVDRRGAPVAFVIASAGTHDSKLLFPNLKKFIILRNSKVLKPEILSLDKAYANNTVKDKLKKRNIQYRIPNKKNARNPERIAPLNAFRWTVERIFAWFNAFRAVKTYREFKLDNYTALFQLASAIILFRMCK